MILAVIGGMVMHNIFDLIKKVKSKNKHEENNGEDDK
jgi:hypothetical protein